MRRLDDDDAVELIVVVSKPPADDVAAEIREYAASLATPVEFALLDPGQPDLTAATERVLGRLGRAVPTWPVAGRVDPSLISDGSTVKGLFVGGTLASEARIVHAGTFRKRNHFVPRTKAVRSSIQSSGARTARSTICWRFDFAAMR